MQNHLDPTINKESVLNTLRMVMDPELNIDVVSLGLIYEVKISEIDSQTVDSNSSVSIPSKPGKYKVFILMTLTSPGCPLAGMFDDLVGGAVRRMPEVATCTVDITFDPPWSTNMMTEEARAELGFL